MSAALQEAFDAQLARNKKSIEALNKQLNAKEEAEAAERDNDVKIASMVLSVVSKIPKPKDGKDGYDGVDGINGVNGTDGREGPMGPQGPKGETGAQGPKGDKGDTGANGIDGKDGKDGLDGTLGAKGEKGDKGDTGEAGKDGLDGRDGTNGKDGIDGKDGAVGPRGEPGIDGKDGYNGLQGPAGADGKKGPKGDQGPRGLPGKQGLRGKEGPKGKPGADGIGITDINAYGQDLHITLTNGTTRQVHMPIRSSDGVSPAMPAADFQRASRVPYDSSRSTLSADTVQGAIDQLASTVNGNPFPLGSAESFMYNFTLSESAYGAEFVYNVNNQLIHKNVVGSGNVTMYTVDIVYSGTTMIEKLVTNILAGDKVSTAYIYENGLLIRKELTYIGV